MRAEEARPYLDRLIAGYAADHVRNGRWSPEEAPAEARKEVERLLPAGVDTPNHLLFRILAGEPETYVGELWIALEPRGAFVYDLEVAEPFRRRGYAEAAMRLAEEIAVYRGACKILLHVFGDNAGARRLYARLGYAETNVLMAKPLDGAARVPRDARA